MAESTVVCPCGYPIIRPNREGTGVVCSARSIIFKSLANADASAKCPRCRRHVSIPILFAPRASRCIVTAGAQ